MKKSSLLLILLGALVLPGIASAQSIAQIFAGFEKAAWTIGSALVIFFWIAVGVQFMTSGGEPEKISAAKKSLGTAIAGTIIIILAFSVTALLSNIIGV